MYDLHDSQVRRQVDKINIIILYILSVLVREKTFHYSEIMVEFVVGQFLSELSSGPALGMFEVFGRTGPQNLRGPQFWTLQKLTCQVWPVYSLTLFANSLKLPPDVRF